MVLEPVVSSMLWLKPDSTHAEATGFIKQSKVVLQNRVHTISNTKVQPLNMESLKNEEIKGSNMSLTTC